MIWWCQKRCLRIIVLVSRYEKRNRGKNTDCLSV
jgi:hypothetical protein